MDWARERYESLHKPPFSVGREKYWEWSPEDDLPELEPEEEEE